MIKRFFKDLRKYFVYSFYNAKALLKADVSGSYLNWLWWFLNPICYMLIYAVIFGVVFNAKEQYFPVFIFIGLSIWDFFNHVISQGVKEVKKNKNIVNKIYIPKYILVLSDMLLYGFKMVISFAITAVAMVIFRIRPTWSMLYIFPIIMTLCVLTFGCATILLHLGVFVQDLNNMIDIVLKLVFYFTGIFYDIMKRIPAPLNTWAVRLNPIACFIVSARDALLNGKVSNVYILLVWFVIGCILSVFGVSLIYKNENAYVKVG